MDQRNNGRGNPEFGVVSAGEVFKSGQSEQAIADRSGAQDEASQLLNGNGYVDIDGGGTETHLVVAGLVAEFADHGGGTFRSVAGSLEFRRDVKISGKHENGLAAHLGFFGFGVRNVLCLERTARPVEFQRNKIFVLWLVAIDVKAGKNGQIENLGHRRTALHREGVGGMDDQLTLLRRAAERQEEQECAGKR